MTPGACAEIIRKSDPVHFLAAMAAPVAARLMALAIHFDRMIREGAVGSYSEIAPAGRGFPRLDHRDHEARGPASAGVGGDSINPTLTRPGLPARYGALVEKGIPSQ